MPDDLSIFKAYYENNSWGSAESASGVGSTLDVTEVLRNRLVKVFTELNIKTLVDAPCGDMNWMKKLDYKFDRYIGVDIVPALIDKLRKQEFPKHYHFQIGNIVTDILPKADAIFCRDCLVHLSFPLIYEAKRLFKIAGFKYIFATTFPSWKENSDCPPGGWRALNMEREPFYWGEPDILILEEAGVAPPYDDKSIGVWAL